MSIETRDQPPAGRIILTYEDYCALPNDGRRYEILEGELAATPSPSRSHQRVEGDTTFAPSLFPSLTISLSSLWG